MIETRTRRHKWVRQFHRWMSIGFTVAVLLNIAVQGQGALALWVGTLTLVPLLLLLVTGLYLFALPHAAKWRGVTVASARGGADGLSTAARGRPTLR
jgi:hypothetical protein